MRYMICMKYYTSNMSKDIAPQPVQHIYEYPWWADILRELEDITEQILTEHLNHEELEQDLIKLNNFFEQFDMADWFNGE